MANRFFGEGTASGVLGLPTGKGNARTIRDTIAIYMPQTLKFNMAAEYGPAEIGGVFGSMAKIKDAFNAGEFFGEDAGAIAQQAGKLITGLSSFATGGLGAGLNAAIQRRTGIAPAAMTEMIFNGIDYRNFSFTFKFTPRTRKESDVVNNMLHTINKSPFENNTLSSCFSLIAKDSSVILIEDAVVASMQNTKFSDLVSKASKDNKVYVLEPDLLARGLDKSKIIDGVTPVGYDDFVDLTVEHDSVQSWL